MSHATIGDPFVLVSFLSPHFLLHLALIILIVFKTWPPSFSCAIKSTVNSMWQQEELIVLIDCFGISIKWNESGAYVLAQLHYINSATRTQSTIIMKDNRFNSIQFNGNRFRPNDWKQHWILHISYARMSDWNTCVSVSNIVDHWLLYIAIIQTCVSVLFVMNFVCFWVRKARNLYCCVSCFWNSNSWYSIQLRSV